MPLVIYKPTTAGRRQTSVIRGDVTTDKPVRRLLVVKKSTSGRNTRGKLTVRHRGGGEKRHIRIVDTRTTRYDAPATVRAIAYDPNRSARLALVEYADGVQAYTLAALDCAVGSSIVASQQRAPIRPGNRMPLEHIPIGMLVHDIELHPGQGGVLARSAGTGAQLMALEGNHAQVRLPSGEVRNILRSCAATIGQVGNPDARLVRIGKAGRKRHMGWRPTVRGKVMNPVDHPHGGGEGRNSIGLTHPKTPWGKHALGVKTRKPKKWSNVFIVERRKK